MLFNVRPIKIGMNEHWTLMKTEEKSIQCYNSCEPEFNVTFMHWLVAVYLP